MSGGRNVDRDDDQTAALVAAAAERSAPHTGVHRLIDPGASGGVRRLRDTAEIERDASLRLQVKLLWAAATLALSLAGGGLLYVARLAINGAFELGTERAEFAHRLRTLELAHDADQVRIKAVEDQLNQRGKP
jgi:hypothetical protein